MGTLEPLAGRGPALAKPAENAALGSSLDTFLMTSIFDIACLELGGFSVTEVEIYFRMQHVTFFAGSDDKINASHVNSHIIAYVQYSNANQTDNIYLKQR